MDSRGGKRADDESKGPDGAKARAKAMSFRKGRSFAVRNAWKSKGPVPKGRPRGRKNPGPAVHIRVAGPRNWGPLTLVNPFRERFSLSRKHPSDSEE